MPAINDRPLEHTSRNGTWFSAPRCDLRGGVVVVKPVGLDEKSLAQDLIEFAAWHSRCIWDQLNGFPGYDCLLLDIRTAVDEDEGADGMTVGEFAALVKDGGRPVVTFSQDVNEIADYLEAGMRGRVIGLGRKDGDVLEIKIDLTEFDAANQLYETANYYDENQIPRLTAREAGHYKPQLSLYLMLDQPGPWVVESAPRLSLHARFAQEGAGVNYLQWLEDQVLAKPVA